MEENNSEFKLHAMDYWQVLRNRYGIILLTFLLVLLVAGVITYILPRQYVGRVVMEIQKQGRDLEIFSHQSGAANPFYSHQYLQTQFEIITSKETLYRVIDDLNLVERWGVPNKAAAYGSLAGRTSTNARRQTDLIEIEVFAGDPEEAAELANAVANEYKLRRLQVEDERSQRSRESLAIQLSQMEEKVEQSQAAYIDLLDQKRVFETGGGASWSTEMSTVSETLVQSAEHDLYRTRQEIQKIRSNIEILQGLEKDDLIERCASLNIQDSHLRTKYEEYKRVQLDRQSMKDDGLGAKHPNMLKLANLENQLYGMLESAAGSYQASLQTNLDMSENELKRMEQMKDKQEDEAIDTKRDIVSLQQAKMDYDLQRQLYAEMEQTLRTKQVDDLMPKTPSIIHEKAEANNNPAKPKVGLNLALGAAVGLLFGTALAFFLEYMDTSVKSLEDVERYLGVPVLAVIPRDVGVLHKQSGASPDAEAYRILRTNIEFNRRSADANALSVVSGGAGEGKSTTLVNLAYICAQGGYTTLLIDADLRRPSLHHHFDITNNVGLTNYLTTDLMLEDVVLQTPVDNLYFLPSGILPADAAGILNSRRMSDLIADVKSRFDLVLVDSPPILGVSDASVIASEVDMTMIVIQHRKLPRNMLLRVKQAVDGVGGHVVGAVLNNVDVRSDNQYQYYTSYYTYYSPTNTGDNLEEQFTQEQAPMPNEAPAGLEPRQVASNQTPEPFQDASPFGAAPNQNNKDDGEIY